MRFAFHAIVSILLLVTTPLNAGERVNLGFGRLLVNDVFGDQYDRWHTGSGVVSALRGPEGTQGFANTFGALIEYRFQAAILAPGSIRAPALDDRPYAGVLSFGVHTHFTEGAFEGSVGIDIVATGPQTGMGNFQGDFHDLLDVSRPSAAVLAGQIPNHFYPTALVEAARPIRLSERLTLRPFVQAQAGVENYLRVGGDIMWGTAWDQQISLRDTTTGLFYQASRGMPAPGVSLLFGVDVTHVFSSAFLPAAQGYTLTATRSRARLGVHVQGRKMSVFYGVAWLGREFVAQPEGQVVGAVRFGLKF